MSSDTASLVVRTATLSDLEAMTSLHMRCFSPEEHLGALLGRSFVQATYRWHIESDEASVLVTEHDNTIVGVIGMSDRSYTAPMFRACLGELLLSLAKRPSLLFNRSLWRKLIGDLPRSSSKTADFTNYPGVCQASIIAVDPSSRGQGVASSLISEVVMECKTRGRAVSAHTYDRNSAIRHILLELGWVELPSPPTEERAAFAFFLDPTLPRELGLPDLIDAAEAQAQMISAGNWQRIGADA